jgi:hypothetical protein
MANLSVKLSALLLIGAGILIILISLYIQAIYVTYTGLGILFWGTILTFITKDNSRPAPSQKEMIRNIEVESKANPLNMVESKADSLSTRSNYSMMDLKNSGVVIEKGRSCRMEVEPIGSEPYNNSYCNPTEAAGIARNEYQSNTGPLSASVSPRNINGLTREEQRTLVYQIEHYKLEQRAVSNTAESNARFDAIEKAMRELLSGDPTKIQAHNKRIDELFEELVRSKEDARRFFEKYRNTPVELPPKLRKYVLEITQCPLRRRDLQDCTFCEAQNCKDRISLEHNPSVRPLPINYGET